MAGTSNSIMTPQGPMSAQVIANAAQATFPPTTTPSNTFHLIPTGTNARTHTAGPNGSRCVRLRVTPQTTIAAAHGQLFRSSDGGTTKTFVQGVAIAAVTVDTTHAATPVDFGYSDDSPLELAPNEDLYVACSLSTAVSFDMEMGDR